MTANVDLLVRAFARQFGRPPEVISEAPGRANLIGEPHTDYNQGFVLPVAIDRTVAVVASPEDEARVRVYSLDFDECAESSLAGLAQAAGGGWRDYVRGVVWALGEAGHTVRGADLAISGDVPRGAGISSSAAVELAVAGALCAVSGIDIEPQDLALICEKAENEFAGVQCGIMDQLAAACSRVGHALLIDCRSLRTEYIPLPAGVEIVVVDSKVPRNLDQTAYNRRRKECAEAAHSLAVRSLRDASLREIERRRAGLSETLIRRARHVVSENARVLSAVEALTRGDAAALGQLMYESHASLRDDFEVSTPELDLLVDLASRAECVLGARLTGAGFGGCTVNLVAEGAEERLESEVVEEYRRKTGLSADMDVCRSVGGLRVQSV